MAFPNQPLSSRYVKARLRVLAKPIVWGPAALLVLASLFMWEYWTQPDRLRADRINRTSGPDSTDLRSFLSSEERAIGADIDSSSVLSGEIGSTLTPSPLLAEEEPTQANQTTQPGNTLQGRQNSQASLSTGQRPEQLNINPFSSGSLDRGLSLLGSSSSDTATGTANPNYIFGIDSFNTPSPSSSRQSTALQTALEQQSSSSSNQSSSSESEQQQTTAQQPVPSTPNQQLLPTPALSGQGVSGQMLPRQFQTSPTPGTTGYTVPPVLNLAPSTPQNSFTNLTRPQTAPGVPGAAQFSPSVAPIQQPNYSASPYQNVNQRLNNSGYSGPSYTVPDSLNQTQQLPRAEPAPFSAPRSIGGGRINTFSNP